MTLKLSKREFLKTAGLGGCGLALCLGNWKASAFGLPPLSEPQDLWKWSREAIYYIETPKGIKCKLCPQACEIKPGETGDCRTRVVKDNKLYTIAYGNPCAIHVDPIEKKPLNHFYPGSAAFSIATAGCNLACLNCQNWNISQISPKESSNYDLMPERVVQESKRQGCSSIAYTYSDPVAYYEYTYDTAVLAKQEGIKNVFISAGYINEKPLLDICPYIDAANIDLKSFSDEVYEMLNAGTLQPVLDTLLTMKENGVWLEITNLVVPEWTDDMDMIKKMCGWLTGHGFENTPLHFSRFQPLYKLTHLPPTPVNTLTQARKIALSEGMRYVYIGNVPGSDAENTYCHHCGKIAVERKGYSIVTNAISGNKCLHCGGNIPGIWN